METEYNLRMYKWIHSITYKAFMDKAQTKNAYLDTEPNLGMNIWIQNLI